MASSSTDSEPELERWTMDEEDQEEAREESKKG